MAKEKKVKEKVALDPFTEWAHKSGRIFMVLFIAYMLVIPFIVCTVYDCMPSFKMCLPGLIAITAIMGPASIAEVGSYTPILGSSTYLTFASGNVMNLKIPCIINAQQIAKVEPNTVEGDAIALIATAVSSAVTIIIHALEIMGIIVICVGAIRDFVRRQSLPRAKGASCAFTPTRNRETDLWHRSVSLFYDHPANFRRPLPISLVP